MRPSLLTQWMSLSRFLYLHSKACHESAVLKEARASEKTVLDPGMLSQGAQWIDHQLRGTDALYEACKHADLSCQQEPCAALEVSHVLSKPTRLCITKIAGISPLQRLLVIELPNCVAMSAIQGTRAIPEHPVSFMLSDALADCVFQKRCMARNAGAALLKPNPYLLDGPYDPPSLRRIKLWETRMAWLNEMVTFVPSAGCIPATRT